MNVTVSIEDDTVERVREIARMQGTSLNEMVRGYLRAVAGRRTAEELVADLERQWSEVSTEYGDYRFRRDDAYEDRS